MSLPSTLPPPPTPGAGAGRTQSWWRRRWWVVVLCGALVLVVSVCGLGLFIWERLTLPPSCTKAADPTRSGAVSQYCPPGIEPGGFALAFGSDGNVWFTTAPNDTIARMSPHNEAVTTFAAPTKARIGRHVELVRGSDGNIWYTAQYLLGRITMQGQVTEFALPEKLGRPDGMAAGAQGPLWLAMSPTDSTLSTFALLAITLPSDLTQAPHITPMALPADTRFGYLGQPVMAAGHDGSLWVATNPTTLVRITPAGKSTPFPLHIPGPAPSCGSACERVAALTAGPDDAMWFIDGWNHVGRITPDGATTYFPLPKGWDLTSVAMGAGPDGNIWFSPAGSGSSNIGRITPDGTVTAFSLPRAPLGASSAENIVAGTEGGVWFMCWHPTGPDTRIPRISRIMP